MFRMLAWDIATGSIVHRESIEDAVEALDAALAMSRKPGIRSVGLYDEDGRRRHVVCRLGEAFLPFTARRTRVDALARTRALAILRGERG